MSIFWNFVHLWNHIPHRIGTAVMLINFNTWFNKINQSLAKFWNTSWNHYTTRMTLTISAKSFSWDFIFLLNIWVNSAVHGIPEGVFRENFFVREYVSSSLLIVILRNSFLRFVSLIKISSSVKFLVTSVLNGLKFKSFFLTCHTGDLDIPVARDISQEVWWELGSHCNIFLTSSWFLADHFP